MITKYEYLENEYNLPLGTFMRFNAILKLIDRGKRNEWDLIENHPRSNRFRNILQTRGVLQRAPLDRFTDQPQSGLVSHPMTIDHVLWYKSFQGRVTRLVFQFLDRTIPAVSSYIETCNSRLCNTRCITTDSLFATIYWISNNCNWTTK